MTDDKWIDELLSLHMPIDKDHARDKAVIKAKIKEKLLEARIEGAKTPVMEYNVSTAIAVKDLCEKRLGELAKVARAKHLTKSQEQTYRR